MLPAPTQKVGQDDETVAGAAGGNNEIVVNRSSFEEQFLQCQVCYLTFDESDRKPKTLPCSHLLCLPCVMQLFAKAEPQNSDRKKLRCPSCRKGVVLTEETINELPNNFRVFEMLEFLDQAAAESIPMCSKHRRQELNFFCKKCMVPACRDCTVIDHKESNNHEIVDVKEVLDEQRTQLEATAGTSREILKKITGRFQFLSNASMNLKLHSDRLKLEVDQKFDEYIDVLRRRQKNLKASIDEIVTLHIRKINCEDSIIREEYKQFQQAYDNFMQSARSTDIRKLLSINEDMKANAEKFTPVADETDEELFQSCEFNIEQDNFLISLSEVGTILVKADPELKNEPKMEKYDEEKDHKNEGMLLLSESTEDEDLNRELSTDDEALVVDDETPESN